MSTISKTTPGTGSEGMNMPDLPNLSFTTAIPTSAMVQGSHELPAPGTVSNAMDILRTVKVGCYLVHYVPSGSSTVQYDGTLRVEDGNQAILASGDLYQRLTRVINGTPPRVVALPGPEPGQGIPVLPRKQYRYYLRVTRMTVGTGLAPVLLEFEMHRFTAASASWTNEGPYMAKLQWLPAPPGYPEPQEYLCGDVTNAAGATVGRLELGWISVRLRRASIQIDRVSASELPSDNGHGYGWPEVAKEMGWELNLMIATQNVVEPSGHSWSDAECHAAMLALRTAADLDKEWRYHILCVQRLDSTERGLMYDSGATDSNNVPREGCAISTHWVVPKTPNWGLMQGKRFGTVTEAYFRTAVHETGHAFGLYHNTVDNGFMNTTDYIATTAPPSNPFPGNIKWGFASDDRKRVRHMPDIYIRPGGTPFSTSYATTPISPNDRMMDAQGLTVIVERVLDDFPIGAPVRVNVKLVNSSAEPILAPAELGLGEGTVRGRVVDPSGGVRTFSPLILCLDEEPLSLMAPGEERTTSLTLLRGGQGALFPTSGAYQIEVEVFWTIDGHEISCSGTNSVLVTGARDISHAQAALRVLSEPDTLPVMVIGGDHLSEGVDAIRMAVNDATLRPHYAYIEARRVSRAKAPKRNQSKEVTSLIAQDTVMSPAEVLKAAEMGKANTETKGSREFAAVLMQKTADMHMSAADVTFIRRRTSYKKK